MLAQMLAVGECCLGSLYAGKSSGALEAIEELTEHLIAVWTVTTYTKLEIRITAETKFARNFQKRWLAYKKQSNLGHRNWHNYRNKICNYILLE